MKKVILFLSIVLISGAMFAGKKCCKDKAQCAKTACAKKAEASAVAEPAAQGEMHACCKKAVAAGKSCCKKAVSNDATKSAAPVERAVPMVDPANQTR